VNKLYYADALTVCEKHDGLFDLVYLDPPYATGLTFKTREGEIAYDDKYNVHELIKMLRPRFAAIRDKMQNHAMLYVHLDYRTVHYAKVCLDDIFGYDHFLGEIIWVPGNGSKGSDKVPSTSHQTILTYGKTKDVFYKAPREDFAEGSLKTHFRNVDEDGRAYRDKVVKGKTYRYYADEGRRAGSVWTDLPAMVANSPICGESTGYPTQKPEGLLSRIIESSSNEGAVVADLMCGSGTTLIAAAKSDRQFVGADKSIVAIDTSVKRLATIESSFTFTHFRG
jgi:site-specific DNA-methyltransferase (adenine-specific)